MPPIPTGTLTLLFTDIESSTLLWERAPEAMDEALRRHDELLRTVVNGSGGYVFKTAGDSFCVAFPAAEDALRAAASAQRAMAAEPWPDGTTIRVRMALHTGACVERDGDYFGPTVNRVARLEATAHGGQVLLSQTTTASLDRLLPPGLSLRHLGSHRLKDLGRPEEIFQLVIEGARSDFPPLRSLDNPSLPNNLPQTVSSFVGRPAEVAEVRRLTSDNRLVTLTGAGGVGKTRLALQVGAELLDGSGDGVWLVELATVNEPDAVPAAVARVLGIKEQLGRAMSDVLVDALAEQYVLIVLDNCEHVISACAKLADILLRSCPRVHLLTTSREPLGIDGEHVFRVPSLSLPPEDEDDLSQAIGSEAVTLFVERASAQSGFTLTSQTAPLVSSICRRLDGVPLAIELAAARLRSMSLSHLNERLDERFRLLTGGSRTALPRQQTLRAMVDWSYSLLNEMEQATLRRLSVFVGGFELEAAEAVCGFDDLEGFEVSDLVGSLVDKSLVEPQTTGATVRYRLLETIREYSNDKITSHEPSEATRARTAHAEVFLALGGNAETYWGGPEQFKWFDRLNLEHHNLHRALSYLVVSSDGPEESLRLGTSLERFWAARGYVGEGIELLRAALDRPDAAGATSLNVKALYSLSSLLITAGDTSGALTCCEDGLALARKLADTPLESGFLGYMCIIRFRQGDHVTAVALADQAVDLARASGDDLTIAKAMQDRASISAEPGDEVRADFAECLAIFRKERAYGNIIRCLHNLGYVELKGGNLEEARVNLEEALSMAKEFHDNYAASSCLSNLTRVALLQQDVVTAEGYVIDSLVAARRANLRGLLPHNVLFAALCASANGDHERGATLHGAADALIAGIDETFEIELREPDHARLRQVMGDDIFEIAYGFGRLMTEKEALDLALGQRVAV